MEEKIDSLQPENQSPLAGMRLFSKYWISCKNTVLLEEKSASIDGKYENSKRVLAAKSSVYIGFSVI